jgi:cell division protein FtsI/penicillin-binding protein 2
MMFGQGMTVTMVQEASAFSAAINGGVYYTPQILSGRLNDDGSVSPTSPMVRKSDVITPATSEKLRGILEWARGTSAQGTKDKPGYSIGGKSGTAQVYDPSIGGYSATDTIGSYIGYGGQGHPEYVIMVRVMDAHIGDFAGTAAAGPIFADISNWLLDYLKIGPRG